MVYRAPALEEAVKLCSEAINCPFGLGSCFLSFEVRALQK